MKLYIQTPLILALGLTLGACAKKNSALEKPVTPPPAVPTVDLSGKTTAEVLQIKYKKASLDCRLFNQNGPAGSKVDLAAPADDSFSWDLLADSNVSEKTFKLTSNKADTQFLVLDMKLSSLSIVNDLNLTDEPSKGHYKMKFSPVLEYTFSIKGRFTLGESGFGSIDAGNDFQETRKIYERVLDIPEDSAISVSDEIDPTKRFFRVDCQLATEAKPGFEDQYVKE